MMQKREWQKEKVELRERKKLKERGERKCLGGWERKFKKVRKRSSRGS